MQYTGLTGDSHVSCQRPTASAEAVSDQLHRCHPTGLTDALHRKGPAATNGSMDLVGYIYIFHPPGISRLLELLHVSNTPTKLSKPTQVHIDQILRFSTSFVSVSARLALE